MELGPGANFIKHVISRFVLTKRPLIAFLFHKAVFTVSKGKCWLTLGKLTSDVSVHIHGESACTPKNVLIT